MAKKIPKITVWIGCVGAEEESIKVGKVYVLNVRTDFSPTSSSSFLVFISKTTRFNRISNDKFTRINTDDRRDAYAAWSKVRIGNAGNGEAVRILITPLVPGIVDIDVLFFFKKNLRWTARLEVSTEMPNLRGVGIKI